MLKVTVLNQSRVHKYYIVLKYLTAYSFCWCFLVIAFCIFLVQLVFCKSFSESVTSWMVIQCRSMSLFVLCHYLLYVVICSMSFCRSLPFFVTGFMSLFALCHSMSFYVIICSMSFLRFPRILSLIELYVFLSFAVNHFQNLSFLESPFKKWQILKMIYCKW